uniref:Uncharacterized protein n=1 Tax=Arundo donax TaxID=35708 RepID=A0A0A9EST9_ARUDO
MSASRHLGQSSREHPDQPGGAGHQRRRRHIAPGRARMLQKLMM